MFTKYSSSFSSCQVSDIFCFGCCLCSFFYYYCSDILILKIYQLQAYLYIQIRKQKQQKQNISILSIHTKNTITIKIQQNYNQHALSLSLIIHTQNQKINKQFKYMSSQIKRQIVNYCKEVNQKCQIQYKNFTFEELKTRKWYLCVLEILFPHLEQKIEMIRKMTNQAKALNAIIAQINDLDQFQHLEIEGGKIANGDQNQIQNMVQVIQALCQLATQQYQQMQIQDQQQYKNYQKQIKNQIHQKQKKSISDYDKPKSVQAIFNQFDKSQEQDQQNDYKNMQRHDKSDQSNKKPMVETVAPKNKRQVFNQPYKKFPEAKEKSSEFSDENRFLEQKMTHSNSNDNKIKQKLTKNPQRNPITVAKSSQKKLVTHPKSPQTLKKAKSIDQIALTNKINQDIKKTKKKQKKLKSQVFRPQSPTQKQIKRKNNEYQYLSTQHTKQKKQTMAKKQRKRDHTQKNQQNLHRILNFREQQLKKQQKQYKQSIKQKLQSQKQQYIKKINNLIIQLQKQRKIQQKKDFKQQLVKQNQQAVKRLTSLQQWYKNKLNILKQNRRNKNQERVLIKTGHKQIISRIQKQLKKQNQEKLMKLTNMYRIQQDNIQTDFQELKSKIIKAYQRN